MVTAGLVVAFLLHLALTLYLWNRLARLIKASARLIHLTVLVSQKVDKLEESQGVENGWTKGQFS